MLGQLLRNFVHRKIIYWWGLIMFKKYCLIISICLFSNAANAQTESNINIKEKDRVKINLTQVSEVEEESLPWLTNDTSDDSEQGNTLMEGDITANSADATVNDAESADGETENSEVAKIDITDMKSILSIYYKNDQTAYQENDKDKIREIINSYTSSESNNITLKSFVYAKNDDMVSNIRRVALKRAFEVRKYLLENGVDEAKVNILISTNVSEEDSEDRIDVFLGS